MASDNALNKLCASAGGNVEQVLQLLSKICANIADHPQEMKFRSLKLNNEKLKASLFVYPGATDFLAAAGFVQQDASTLTLPASAGVAFSDAFATLRRRYAALSESKQRAAMAAAAGTSDFKLVVEGGVKGAGHRELAALAGRADGVEALKTLQTIVANIRKNPAAPQYKSVNLKKAAGQKVLLAWPLMELVGFERVTTPEEDRAQLKKLKNNALERLWAMLFWTLRPAFNEVRLPPLTGVKANALASLLGFAIGDAFGAPLEGADPLTVKVQEVDKATEMCGGGKHTVAPGQVTDATELMICTAEGLAAGKGSKKETLLECSSRYILWHQSKPFDIEKACEKSFSGASPAPYELEKRALRNNGRDDGNGALMRCLPMASWAVGRGLSSDALSQAARADAKLSHPDWIVGDVCAAYVVCAAHLIKSGGDRAGALTALQAWAKEEKKAGRASDTLEEWLNEALSGAGDLGFGTDDQDVSSSKIAFTHALRFLKNGTSFEIAMRSMLAGGGDTATNAAIVGGLIGAAVGLQGIPERSIRAVLASGVDPTIVGQERPEAYHPQALVKVLDALCG